MASQFDVFRDPDGVHVVLIQTDLLGAMQTRVVVPLLPPEELGRGLPALNPRLLVGGTSLVLVPQLLSAVPLAALKERLGSLAHERDTIIRALDALLSGV